MQVASIDRTPPTPIRAAATVLICRDGAAGLEVFLIQRHGLSDVHGGSYVFPGGKVDPADSRLDFPVHLDQEPARLHALLNDDSIDETAAAAIHVAAVREVFEECGLLIAHGMTQEGLRRAFTLAAEGIAFNEVLRLLELRLDTHALRPWSRWITPARALTSDGKRFDTRFFVAEAPVGQLAGHDNHEAVHSVWLRPRDALEKYWRGEIVLAPPQIMSLAHLGRHASVSGVFAEAQGRAPFVVRPHTFEFEGARAAAYPGDEVHPERVRVMPGPLRLILRGKRLEPPGGFEDLWR